MSARDRTPPTTEAAASSSPMTPDPKRTKIGSPGHATETTGVTQSTQSVAKVQETEINDSLQIDRPKDAEHVTTSESAPALAVTEKEEEEAEVEQDLEADDRYADSAFGTDNSDSTSITSSIYDGYIENGRRYQSKREGEYWSPADEKQYRSQQKAHILHCILDSEQENPSFYSPIPETAQNILDIGTGTGDWARDVADRFPGAYVQGIDLSPPPDYWVPPNCKFEVDDILKPWEFNENGKFDLVHMRFMYGAFTDEQWRLLYKQAYNNLAPGGWIEQVEPDIRNHCDDGTMPLDSVLATCGQMGMRCFAKSGKSVDTEAKMKSRIQRAGFTNIHEKNYKVPIGDWAKSPLLKEAGLFHKAHSLEGAEGFMMFLLTHFGEPEPWTPQEVQVYVAKFKNAVNDPSIHAYQRFRRVWAQKPYDSKPAAKRSEPVVENIA